ncbi:MAG: nucleotidyltransferase domain-containing protein [Rubrivivax sp.]
MDKFGLGPLSAARLRQALAAQAGLRRAWIYGSRATGAYRTESDIDLAIEAAGWTAEQRLDLLEAIQRLGLLYRVDVVFLDQALPDRLRCLIDRDKQVFWQQDGAEQPRTTAMADEPPET